MGIRIVKTQDMISLAYKGKMTRITSEDLLFVDVAKLIESNRLEDLSLVVDPVVLREKIEATGIEIREDNLYISGRKLSEEARKYLTKSYLREETITASFLNLLSKMSQHPNYIVNRSLISYLSQNNTRLTDSGDLIMWIEKAENMEKLEPGDIFCPIKSYGLKQLRSLSPLHVLRASSTRTIYRDLQVEIDPRFITSVNREVSVVRVKLI